MRTEQEIYTLILNIAKNDANIRAVFLQGSRANPEALKDMYQDYDIVYCVKDISKYYPNLLWLENSFGKASLSQIPKTMNLSDYPPNEDDPFSYLMLFEDGIRIDLSFVNKFQDTQEPTLVLLDKDNHYPNIKIDPSVYHIQRPDEKLFHDVCNEFWWCANNVIKGIARDEIPYAQTMIHTTLIPMLHHMIDWKIGLDYDFKVSSGKMGKYYKHYLSNENYEAYLSCYQSGQDVEKSLVSLTDFFSLLAQEVSAKLKFSYHNNEEAALLHYMNETLR